VVEANTRIAKRARYCHGNTPSFDVSKSASEQMRFHLTAPWALAGGPRLAKKKHKRDHDQHGEHQDLELADDCDDEPS
jgi:hypothetical protein